jgi:hypothetical protein
VTTIKSYILWPNKLKHTTSISEENCVQNILINSQFKAKCKGSFIILTCNGLLNENVMTGRSFTANRKAAKQYFARDNPHLSARSQ